MSELRDWFENWAYGKPSKDPVMNHDELILQLAEHLKHEESFIPYVYDDAYVGAPPYGSRPKRGTPTIGYGHAIKRGESFTTLTEPEAFDLLIRDIKAHMAPIIPAVRVPLALKQWIMIMSHAFNGGPNTVLRSRYFALINSGGSLDAIRENFLSYNKGRVNGQLVVMGGLKKRREKEWKFFADAIAQNDPKIALA